MKQFARTIALAWFSLVFCGLACADEGMWLLSNPPTNILKQRYGFEPSQPWLEHLQKSCVRFSTGGSGSIVSADGLVMTNHHVGSDMIEKLSTPDRNLLDLGFYAKSHAEELACPDLELLALWSIEDVTDRVKAAAGDERSSADANTARRKMITTIEDEAKAKTGLHYECVTLYGGGQYHLYGYKRFTDVRLVFAPEAAIAFFGGDTDNFEYPRFDLDVCFFRIYQDGQPLKPEHHLEWSAAGAKENDLAIVCGHPGRTERLNTLDHLKFMRDVDTPFVLRNLWRREVQLATFRDRNAENHRIGSGDYYSVQNSRKAVTGIMAGLLEPDVVRAKEKAEEALRAAVQSNSEYQAQWGDAWLDIANAYEKFGDFYDRYQLLEGRRRALRSDLFNIARHLVQLVEEKAKPSAERLPEYSDSELDSLYLELYSPAPIYDALEIDRLASGLSLLAETFGREDPVVMQALQHDSPRSRAEALVRGTKLKDVETRKAIAEGDRTALLRSKDPMIQLAMTLDVISRAHRQRYEDEVEAVEREAYAKIAAAQFAVQGENVYPDATYSLRLAFGPIKGYQENGQAVPPFTTMGGAYQRMEERGGAEPFKLTPRWLERKGSLDLDTPYNFVCTADIIGGNSGSPVVNAAGEVIGLVFDGNIHSLVWDIAYSDQMGRAVAVDGRAIIECLQKLYDAGALADELTKAAPPQTTR